MRHASTFLLTAALVVTLTSCTTGGKGSSMNAQTLVFEGATVITGLPAGPIEGGTVVIAGDRIVGVGPAGAVAIPAGARVVDASGLTIMPGLIDSHAHIGGLGDALHTVRLAGSRTEAEMIDRIAAFAAKRPAGEWVSGRGWDQNDWPVKEYPTAAALDVRVGDHPVWVRRIDGHAGLANRAAMKIAGITRETPDPDGGRVIRDSDGEPTGVFIDNAMNLVEAVMPAPSRAVRKERYRDAARAIAAHGLTAVHDAGIDDEGIGILEELAREGALPIRAYLMLADDAPLIDSWLKRGPRIGSHVTVRSIKLYADGALGSRGAALLAPYSDEPHNHGLLVSDPAHIADVAKRARAAGFQVNTHAIGDRAVRVVLDAYDGAGVTPADRFRIEHLQVIALEDLPRLAKRGVIAAMQPTHATSDMPWAEARLGAERIGGAYAWRKVLDAGARLSFGSDFPVEEVSPFLGIHAAVTRQDGEGHPPGGWHPEERLTVDEAIRGFTLDAAFSGFEETSRGTIEEGKLADLTITSENPHSIAADGLDDMTVRYTVVGGAIVFDAAVK